MNNLVNQNNFKGKKTGYKLVNEMVERIGDNLVVTIQVAVPQKLVKEYSNKVKLETGRDILTEKGDMMIAETLVNWVNQNLLNLDNLGANIMLGNEYNKTVQVQPQSQPQPAQTAQEIPAQETQGQVQVQTQGQGQGQVQTVQSGQGQGQGQVQGQGQGQGQAEI